MCDRYHLLGLWRDDAEMRRLGLPQAPLPPGLGERIDCVRSTWAPIVRDDGLGALQVENRRWGFHRHYPATERRLQPAKRELFIADGAQVTRLPSFQPSFALRRCLVPMSSWSERPHAERKKELVEIFQPDRPVFAVAGLYETSQDIRTGLQVETFIILTRPDPTSGSARHAVPLVLDERDYLPWLHDGHAAHRLARGDVHSGRHKAQVAKARMAEFFGGQEPVLRF